MYANLHSTIVPQFLSLAFSFSSARVTDDGHYLMVKVYRGAEPKNHLYFYDLSGGIKSPIPLTPIVSEFEASYDVMFIIRI